MISYEITIGSEVYIRRSSEAVYETIIDEVFGGDYDSPEAHNTAEDASSWCELNCVGDTYYGDEFTIEIVRC